MCPCTTQLVSSILLCDFVHFSDKHAMSITNSQTIEHIVLFKIKPDSDPLRIDAMVNGLNGLISLDEVAHLTAGPLLRTQSSSPLTFTHFLHARYNSRHDLNSYSAHPAHVNVVKGTKPILDDILAVDWIADGFAGPAATPAGYAARVMFLKLKERSGEKEKNEVIEVIGEMRNQFRSVDQFTFGENFSPDRSKGYSIAVLAVFPGLSELDSNSEAANPMKEKIRDLVEDVMELHFAIPTAR